MIKKIIQLIIVLGITYLALIVRKANYAQIPIYGQSVDEYSYSWVGLSLIKTGVPIGISGISGYQHQFDRYINIDRFMQLLPSDPLSINYPWMDHPPLLGLITGGYASLKGAEVFEDTVTSIIRQPIVFISTISVLLVMIFCWLNFSFLTAIIGGLIYGTAPLIVLSGRMIQAENAIIPCFLLVAIFISLFLKQKKDFWLLLAGIFSGLATLFKLTGVACYIFVLLSLLSQTQKLNQKFWKDFLFFLIIAIPISFLFVIYGSVYGLENFKNILFSNANRFYGIGPSSLIELIRNQRLTQHKFLPEIWVITGWILFIAALAKKNLQNFFSLPVIAIISYLIVYLLFGSQPYGWYTFPFWPFLIIILSRFFSLSIEKGENIVLLFLTSITIFGANISRLLGIFEFQKYAQFWRIGISGILFILIFSRLVKLKSNFISKAIILIILALSIYTNVKYLNQIDIQFWWENIS